MIDTAEQTTVDKRRIALAEAIAEAWSKAGLSFAVIHGIESYPASMGRDLDVLVLANQSARAVEIAIATAASAGWARVLTPQSFDGRQVILVDTDGATYLDIDLRHRLTWRNLVFTDRPEPTYSRGPFAIDPWANVAKRFLMVLLAHGAGRFRERPSELETEAAERASMQRLSRFIDADSAAKFASILERRDVGALEAFVPELRSAFARRSQREPAGIGVAALRFGWRRLYTALRPHSPFVSLICNDRAQLDAVLGALEERGTVLSFQIVVRRTASKRGMARDSALGSMTGIIREWRDYFRRDLLDTYWARAVVYDSALVGSARKFGPPRDRVLMIPTASGAATVAKGGVTLLPVRDSVAETADDIIAVLLAIIDEKNGGRSITPAGR